jgi:uncharacterized protein YkwD
MSKSMSLPGRRIAALAFVLTVAFGAAGSAPSPAAAADLSLGQAEIEMIRLINAERAKAGLVPVRKDTRLMAIARQRSNDMASRHYFSHVQPDGRNAFDLINAYRVTWYGAGEILAWNSGYPTLASSAAAARDGWLGSPGHRAVMMSNSYNYVGIGLAIDSSNGKRIWTGVFIKGPDRTGGWLRFNALKDIHVAPGTYKTVTVTWTGGDIRLQTLTAGFRHYQVQVRTNGGAWKWWSYGTTNAYRRIRVWGGKNYDLRVRACDRVGNCGTWRSQHVDS